MLAPPSAIDHDTLRIPTLSPERAEAAALRCRGANVDGCDVIVPWTDWNAEALAILGEQAVSPVLRDFDFPGPYKPFPHQITMVNDQVVNRRFFNLAAMGVGKTSGSIWAAMYLLQVGAIKNVLVISPVSTMVETWATGFFEHTMQQANVIYGSTKATKVKKAINTTVFNIINYDGVVALNKELLRTQFDLIIVDELRTYGNAGTARWKAIAKLIRPETRVWGLTGTPRSRSPLDCHGMVKLLNPGNIVSSVHRWKMQVMQQYGEWDWRERPEANAMCAAAMQPGRVVSKAEVMKHLPPLTFSYVPVPLSSQQLSYYHELRKQKLVKTDGGADITAVNAAVLVNKLAQVAAGVVYDEEGNAQVFDVSGRMDELLRLCDESLSGTIVFAPYKHTCDLIMLKLGPLGYRKITGDVSLSERTEIFEKVQAGEIPGVVAIPSTMSHGIDLSGASTTIWWSAINSTEVFEQASARMDRGSQKHPMSVYMLYGSAVERKMYQQRQGQGGSQQELLAMFNNFIGG